VNKTQPCRMFLKTGQFLLAALVLLAASTAAAQSGLYQPTKLSYSAMPALWAGVQFMQNDPVFMDRFEELPEIELFEPADGLHTNQPSVLFAGRVDRPAELTINQVPVELDSELEFSAYIELPEGSSLVELRAAAPGGAVGLHQVTVVVITVAPSAADPQLITIGAPSLGIVTLTGVKGSAAPGTMLAITNLRTGETIWVEVEEDGSFTASLEGRAGDEYEIVVEDLAGNQSEPVQIGGGVLNPPPVEAGITTPIIDLEDHLYKGPTPVQIVDDPDVFQPHRFAVIRGMVTNRVGDPLPGVTIRVLGHPELGYTFSREDGEFDLAVNGGGSLVLDFEMHGHLPVQRRIQVPWQDYVYVDEVSLIQLDSKVTVIDLTDESAGMQVARGSVEVDIDGARQVTVLFPQGTAAQAITASGETLELEQISFRATEYTVGERGPLMMPGDLPPNMGYTYAVELSVDEAFAIGASTVEFSQSVPFYVENFLGFPTGTGVPVGYYDRGRGAWVGYENGAVIEILDIVNGSAVLDVTGDGPASTEHLGLLQITEAELSRLAELYEVGDTLQRVALTHFSPWDFNFPFGPPEGAEDPPVHEPPPEFEGDEEDPCTGCVIYPQSRSMSKEIAISGTPLKLRYDSNRTAGYERSRLIEIPITGDTIHPELIRIEASVSIAGRVFHGPFALEPNQNWHFSWDGLDVRGRKVAGMATATIVVRHIYPMMYRVPEGWQSSQFWGMPPAGIEVLDNNRFAFGETWLESTSTSLLHGPDASQGVVSAGLGGWTLNSHHAYAENLGRPDQIQFGYGQDISVAGTSPIIETIAGTGEDGLPAAGMVATEAPMRPFNVAVSPEGLVYIANAWGYIFRIEVDGTISIVAGNGEWGSSGDGGPATEAAFFSPWGIVLADDGSLYIVDPDDHRVRHVDTDGIIWTVAGTGVQGFSGDGGPATDAQFAYPWYAALGADGTLYISDAPNNNRVRQIGTDGIIQTILGSDVWGLGGDGGPAATALVDYPEGVAVGPDGTILVTDVGNHRMRRIGVDGIINTVAGSPNVPLCISDGDGGLAVEARICPFGAAAIAPDGSFFFVNDRSRIRHVGTDGIINTIAGTGVQGYGGDDGPPQQAMISMSYGLAVGPDGSLYIADTNNNRVRRVSFGDPLRVGDQQLIASKDGSEIYIFSERGQHLQTIDALTNGLRWAFSYDDNNALTSISDGDGNTTSIERSSEGLVEAIISPDGHRTELTIDADGYLTLVEDPGGRLSQMEYTNDGLLSAFTDRKGFRTEYFYNERGEFSGSADAVGGGWLMEGDFGPVHSETQMETAEGRTYSFSVETTPGRSRRHVRKGPDGLETRRLISPSLGRHETEFPDGTLIIRRDGPDPRFKMASPIPEYHSIALPSGLTRETLTARNVSLGEESDPLSMTSLTDQRTVNNRTSIMIFDAEQLEWTVQSPTSRQATFKIDQQGRPVELLQAGLAPVAYQYDNRGRPITIASSDGENERTLLFEYHTEGHQAGYLAAITDPLERTTQFEYDAAGRVTRQIFPDKRSVDFDYDEEGNLTSLIPPGRTAHLFQYTAPGNRERYEPPELPGIDSVTVYRYNLDRQLTEIDRPGGETVLFGYDLAGRLDSVTSDAGTVGYSYHLETGQLTGITAPDGITLSYTWDGFLPLSESWSGAVVGSVSWGYDNNFWLTGETAADHVVTFGYDDDGLLTNAGPLSLARHPDHGLLTGTELADIVGTRSYNAFGELLERTVTVDDLPLYQASNNRDLLGRIETQELIINGLVDLWSYQYDDAGRLEQVERNGLTEHVYVYDDNGNRTQHTGPGGVVTIADYDEQDRLTQYGDIVYTHTEAGERLTRADSSGTTTFTYDANTNLRAVSLPDGTQIEYLIDGRDRRVGKKIDGVVQKTWIYRDQLSPVAQFDGDGNLTHRFVYAEQGHSPSWMVKIDPVTEAETLYRLITDHLGSVRLVIDVAAGVVAQRIDYGPFGKVWFDSNPGLQPFGFAGGIYDQHTGLVRFGARDYDPEIGRWTAKDPIGFGGGDSNLYGYAWNNPVNLFDPSGLDVAITINRTDYTGNSIVGTIDVTSTVVSTTYSGYTLEAYSPPNPNLPTPPGTYGAFIRADHTPNRIELIGVPNATNIQIHVGNFPSDVVGCFAVGNSRSTDFVGQSVSAMNEILQIISADGTGNITVVITGNSTSP
jgi:RHS repeat-associated protein